MTPDEIREFARAGLRDRDPQTLDIHERLFWVGSEIAAQMAEGNDLARENRDTQKQIFDLQRNLQETFAAAQKEVHVLMHVDPTPDA